MSDDSDDAGRKLAIVTVAALLFAASDTLMDHDMKRSFDIAEEFVAEAEKRYGKFNA